MNLMENSVQEKVTFFPISNVLYRNRVNPRVNDEQIEVALLIDPSIDNPMDYLILIYKVKKVQLIQNGSN